MRPIRTADRADGQPLGKADIAGRDGAETRTGTQTSRAVIFRPEPGSGPTKRSARKRLVMLVTALVLVAGAAYAGRSWWIYSHTWVKTDNAYVAAHLHTVSSRVAGTVQQVLVDENQAVAQDTLLARLDPRDFEIRAQQSEAQGAVAAAQVRQAEARLAEARAQAAREQARAGKCRLDLARATSLFEGAAGAISKQEFDQAKAEAEAAEAALKAAEAGILSAQALVGAGQAQAEAAQANLAEAKQQLAYTEIRAPAAGRIGKKNLETGNRVQPGQALLALVPDETWVTANFKETQLTRMKPGQAVQIRLDAFPGRVFEGVVESLAPATGAQFALLPPDNATGNFTKIVQRIPVKIVFTRQALGDCTGRIVPGMSAVVEVNVHG